MKEMHAPSWDNNVGCTSLFIEEHC